MKVIYKALYDAGFRYVITDEDGNKFYIKARKDLDEILTTYEIANEKMETVYKE